ncbi:MAG: GTPase Era [Bacteroidales bacterium]|jgi:GTP-binding protein Era|nr:GTPase Era [Bacteroidales bacterium]MDD2569532.1 GTPase Era [Bacteroidales bacterium]MDD2812018.1 GTPase Era [Bacteroidales bacterium]
MKAGFVNIIGNPNVGKSTLMNALVGERVSVITSKSQTTRHRILGIVNGEDYQIVYSDTPGIIKPAYKLQESMLKASRSALTDADILLYVTDVMETPDKNMEVLTAINKTEIPVLLVINKIDISNQEAVEKLIVTWNQLIPRAEIFPSSALFKFNLDHLLNRILELLPESPAYFDPDQLTDRPERFFVTEIIRAAILENYEREIPYSVEPVVDEFKEEEKILKIRVIIYVERDSQKGILIGHNGSALKRVGTQARKEMEIFFDKKVFLELHVKVARDWRNKPESLKSFGYEI